MSTECESCGFSLESPHSAEVGEIVECNQCAEEFEITSIAPFVLRKAPEVEEDFGE